MIEFKLPDLGEGITHADVVNIMVREGDTITAEQNVLELETDKAVVEIPCPHAGRIAKIHRKVGDTVSIGDVLFCIEENTQEETPETPVQAGHPSAQTEDTQPVAPDFQQPDESRASPPMLRPGDEDLLQPAAAGPAVRRLARELGVELQYVNGSGPRGRITPEDVRAYVKRISQGAIAGTPAASGMPPLPDFRRWGEIERVAMKNIRRRTAENLSLSWQLIPHVTQFDLADITAMEAGRKRYLARQDTSIKLTMTVLVMKGVASVLKEFPQFNASIDMEAGEIIYKHYCHIGVAVDTPHGLIVPVIRNVEMKSITQLADELEDVATRARNRHIKLEELQGGTFTITNLGGIGGTAFTPIIHYPEVAILGMARARQEYMPHEGTARFRLMMPLCVSYDHRIIDGADGARFLKKLCLLLSDPVQLMFEI